MDCRVGLRSLAGDVSLDDNNNVVKYTVILAITMAIIYRPYSLVTSLDTCSVKTIVAIVHGRIAGCRCG